MLIPTTGKVKHLEELSLDLTNTCNYACRHCSAEYSSCLDKDSKEQPVDLTEFEGTDLHKWGNSYANNLESLDEIENLSYEDLEIEITGGEFFSKKKKKKIL